MWCWRRSSGLSRKRAARSARKVNDYIAGNGLRDNGKDQVSPFELTALAGNRILIIP